MFANVVVLTYQSPEIDTYSYEIPENLKGLITTGQLVGVPFGKRNPMGIILETRNQKPETFKVKPINSIFFYQPILLPYQITLLKWLSFYYHAPMVNCLEAILPELPAKLSNYSSSGVKRNREVSSESKFSTSSNNMQKALKQILVLVPSINRLPKTLAQFPTAKNYTIYHNELKTSEKFATWLKILKGNVDFVFGSRSAIFTPCPALSKIIIFDEHDVAYKDERSPYFDTLTIAEKIGQIVDAKIQIIDTAPKISTYFSHKNDTQIPRAKTQTTIVPMTSEINKGNRTAVSDLLSSLIIKTVKQKGRALLFLNKKRESGQLYCKACRFHEFLPNAPGVCPNCKSADFYFNSLNIWSLAKTIKQIVPNTQINLIAEDSNYQLPNSPTIQLPTIDIATASVFYRLAVYKYDLVAHILTDTTLNIADFSAPEKTFVQIINLKNLIAENGRFILQTYNEDHPVIKAAAQGNFPTFFAQSLRERKALLYPPFALLIKLTIKGKSQQTIEKKAEKLAQELNQLPDTSYQTPVIVLGPYESIFSAKIPRYNIILKHKLDSYSISDREKAIKSLSLYLEKVPRDWQITIEPTSLN